MNGGVNAHSLYNPISVALDAHGNLYVADYGDSRVLEFYAPLTTDGTADRIFGPPDFTHYPFNNGRVSLGSLNGPTGVAVLFGAPEPDT